MKAILVGRHAGELPDVDVIEQRAITWPARSEECVPIMHALFADASAIGAVVLFQNTPGQVTACLVRMMAERHAWQANFSWPRLALGVIVSVPGPRPGRVSRRFLTDDPDTMVSAVLFANPRAVASGHWADDGLPSVVSVEIDGPPMPFEFSHIEWLY